MHLQGILIGSWISRKGAMWSAQAISYSPLVPSQFTDSLSQSCWPRTPRCSPGDAGSPRASFGSWRVPPGRPPHQGIPHEGIVKGTERTDCSAVRVSLALRKEQRRPQGQGYGLNKPQLEHSSARDPCWSFSEGPYAMSRALCVSFCRWQCFEPCLSLPHKQYQDSCCASTIRHKVSVDCMGEEGVSMSRWHLSPRVRGPPSESCQKPWRERSECLLSPLALLPTSPQLSLWSQRIYTQRPVSPRPGSTMCQAETETQNPCI